MPERPFLTVEERKAGEEGRGMTAGPRPSFSHYPLATGWKRGI